MYELADVLRPFQSRRVAKCGRVRVAHEVEIAIRNGKAHYHGLMRCANVWTCPVCGLSIRTGRAAEVRQVVEWHGRQAAYLLTATIAHGLGDDLAEIRRAVALAWRKLQAGDPWKRMRKKYGFVGAIRGLEVTHGANGFHPHLHIILLLRRLDDTELRELETWLAGRWARAIVGILGESARPNAEHGVDLRTCAKADYLAKLGLEVTAPAGKSGRRGNRSPLHVAADFAVGGDEADLAIWRAYCKGMFGAKMLTWSRGLRRAAGFAAEKTDDEIVQGGEDAEIIAVRIRGEEWDTIRDQAGLKVALLVAVEEEGPNAAFRRARQLIQMSLLDSS